jgi:hypothetical protein
MYASNHDIPRVGDVVGTVFLETTPSPGSFVISLRVASDVASPTHAGSTSSRSSATIVPQVQGAPPHVLALHTVTSLYWTTQNIWHHMIWYAHIYG